MFFFPKNENLHILTLHPLHPAAFCTQQSPAPALSWCPEVPGNLRPVSRCLPSPGWAQPPGCWQGPGVGSAADCSGTLFLSVCPPGPISTRDKRRGVIYKSTNGLVCHLFLILLLEGNCYLKHKSNKLYYMLLHYVSGMSKDHESWLSSALVKRIKVVAK